MKKLHEFMVVREKEVEEVQVTKDDKGQDVKTITKVTKPVSHKFFIAKPTRSLFDEADLFYAVKLSEGVKAGLLTRQLLAKRYENDGGAMSEPDKENYVNLYLALFEKQNEYQRLVTEKPEAERTPEEKEKLVHLIKELNETRGKIQELEYNQISLFDQTAESRARNKTILWWVLMLSYKEDEHEKVEPFFGEGEYETRLAKYDEFEEAENEFSLEVMSRFMYYISFWYMGRARKPEDFAELDKPKTENATPTEKPEPEPDKTVATKPEDKIKLKKRKVEEPQTNG